MVMALAPRAGRGIPFDRQRPGAPRSPAALHVSYSNPPPGGEREGTGMRVFHCGSCDQLVFFENTSCVSCGRVLAYLPDRNEVGTLEPAGPGTWRAIVRGDEGAPYRLCRNDNDDHVCN